MDGEREKQQQVGPPNSLRGPHTWAWVPDSPPWPLGRIGGVEPPKLEPHTDVTATQTHWGYGHTKAEYIWVSMHQRS